MVSLGSLIRTYRKEHHLSLRDFALLCDVSHAYIDKLEKGNDLRNGKALEPTPEIIEKIAKALGLSLDTLLKTIGKINSISDGTQFIGPDLANTTPSVNEAVILPQLNGHTFEEEKDVEKILGKVQEILITQKDKLLYSGEPMSAEAVEVLLSSLELGMRHAKLINKKIF